MNYLRLEAVNLGQFLFDTQNLSVMRGSSLMLREAVNHVQARVNALQPVTVGASIGLFEVTGDLAAVEKQVRDALQEEPYGFATFVIDTTEADDFLEAKETLLAKNRWQQFQQPTLFIPPYVQGLKQACGLDDVRPAQREERTNVQGTQQYLSSFTQSRFEYGRSQKRGDFYHHELGTDAFTELTFTDDLQALSKGAPSHRRQLEGKVAVLYFDGNAFTKIQSTVLGQDSTQAAVVQQNFDAYIRQKRVEFLEDVLRTASEDDDWKTTDGAVRLETLLWGGDEFTFVVPAWKGWQLLAKFYDVSKDWVFEGYPLTHAAGLVFASAKAPMRHLTALARSLADDVVKPNIKAKAATLTDLKNAFAYEVLESFDNVSQGLSSFRGLDTQNPHLPHRFGKGEVVDLMVEVSPEGDSQEPSDLFLVAQAFDRVKQFIPRGQLYRLLHHYVEGDLSKLNKTLSNEEPYSLLTWPESKSLQDQLLQDFKLESELRELEALFGADALWFHLVDLWDYLDVSDARIGGQGE